MNDETKIGKSIDNRRRQEPSDEVLILRIAETSDREAFAELFQRYAGRIKAYLIRAGCAHEEAEEGAQEVMVALWRRSASFDPAKASVATWLFTIARNKRIDMVRRFKRPAPDAEDPAFRPADPVDPETALTGVSRDERVRAALKLLSEDQLAVIKLAFFSGLSHAEIAQTVQAPLGTVKSRLRLSFNLLRQELGHDFSAELTTN